MSLLRLLREKGNHVSTFHALEHYEKRHLADVEKSLSALLAEESFDIAHIHILDHKFLSLITLLKRHSIPVIQTLHDHRAICAATAMLRKGKICKACRGGSHFWAGIHGCINLPLALKLFCRFRGLVHNPYRDVRLFISPSRFLIKTFQSWGFRLTAIKGIDTLLGAVKGLPVPLKLAGAGEREGEIEELIAREGMEHVSLTGYLQGDALREAIRDSRFVVVPSECFENSPLAVMEAFAAGKTVVGSDRGGITELLGDNERGLLFPAGDSEKLRESILLLWNDREFGRKLGKSARAYAEEHFSEDRYYQRLMELFKEHCKGGGAGKQ